MPMIKEGNRICRRTYIFITGELSAPLLVGSGEDEQTDMDVILDERGRPFIPGSALAGALRRYLSETSGDVAANYVFGDPVNGEKSPSSTGIGRQSRLFVYDTELNTPKLCYRDGVRLDGFKTVEDKAKYTMQAVERGAGYTIRLELMEREDDIATEAEKLSAADSMGQIRTLIAGLHYGEITLGAKSHRGFGRLCVRDVRIKQFDMTQKESQLAWLDWDWKHKDAFYGAERWDLKQIPDTIKQMEHCLCVPLKIKNTIMIRSYPEDDCGKGVLPDYVQLKSAGKAVIPGTGWMGAIRGRLGTILQDMGIAGDQEAAQKKLETILGSWSAEQALLASTVKVEESILEGGYVLPITRNAIDRFTGGTVRGALYTSEPWVGGHTELALRWPCRLGKVSSDTICGLLLWVISDLQNGLLAVGGETAAGRGIFENNGAVKLDGETIDDSKSYYKAAMDWCKCIGQVGTGGIK